MIVSHVRIIRAVCIRREKLATTGFSRTHPPRSPHSSHQQPNSTKIDTSWYFILLFSTTRPWPAFGRRA